MSISSTGPIVSLSNLELLSYSEHLLATSDEEAGLRAAASRSYYAAYHQAFDLADKLRCPQPSASKKGCHEKIIDRYKDMYSDGFNISRLLQKQKMVRVTADYKLSKGFSREEAKLHVMSCSKLVKSLELMNMISG